MSRPTLNNDQAAEFLGVSPRTLYKWRCTKSTVIPYFKLGKKVKYDEADLQKFIESRKVDGSE